MNRLLIWSLTVSGEPIAKPANVAGYLFNPISREGRMEAIRARLFRLCNLFVALTLLLSFVGVETVSAYPTPWISVWIPQEVHGYNWPDGVPVTLTIAHADAPGSPYYTSTTSPTAPPDLPLETWFAFHVPEPLSIQTGDSVTVTNGALTKTHIVKFAQITLVDTTNDQISGKADPYARLEVSVASAFGPEQHANRRIDANAAGDWTADFSAWGDEPDEQNTVDITETSWGWANVSDEDGDNTTAKWDHNKDIWVRIDDLTNGKSEIDGFSWPIGIPITLTIDDSNTPLSPDHVETLTNNNPNLPLFFNLDYEVFPGYLVTMTDGVITKTHLVKNLSIDVVDIVADTISGTANPVDRVRVGPWNKSQSATREVFADENGAWVADFSIPGSQDFEQTIFDIRPGDMVEAHAFDNDTDLTSVTQQLPNPPLDSDGDGLNDDVDACPDQNPNGHDADVNGCTDTAVGLRQYLTNLPANVVPSNIKTSLLAKVDSAITSLNRGKEQAAIGQLRAFINEVEAQCGKKISETTADLLIAYARNIMAQIP
jgi:hypothetical protein